MQQQYTVKLTGKSQLHEPAVKLENIGINLFSIDGGETWENKNAIVGVTDLLNVFMSCKAISGTGWEFILTNKLTGSKVIDQTGLTGDGGIDNYSQIDTEINP